MLRIDLADPPNVLVVAARPDGFQQVFLNERQWHAVRINPELLQIIRYVAPYISAPVSAITHYANVDSIVPWQDGPRFCLKLSGPPIALPNPIRVNVTGKLRSGIQDRRYTKLSYLLTATNLDEVFEPGK